MLNENDIEFEISDVEMDVDTEHLKNIKVYKYFDDYKFKFTASHMRYADHVENML